MLLSRLSLSSHSAAMRKAIAHFARRNARSTETDMGVSDNGNAHTRIDKSAYFGVRCVLLLGKPE